MKPASHEALDAEQKKVQRQLFQAVELINQADGLLRKEHKVGHRKQPSHGTVVVIRRKNTCDSDSRALQHARSASRLWFPEMSACGRSGVGVVLGAGVRTG